LRAVCALSGFFVTGLFVSGCGMGSTHVAIYSVDPNPSSPYRTVSSTTHQTAKTAPVHKVQRVEKSRYTAPQPVNVQPIAYQPPSQSVSQSAAQSASIKARERPLVLTPQRHHAPITASLYTVQRGDTLYGIGQRSGVPLTDIARANRIPRPYILSIGQKLTIPRGTVPTTQSVSYEKPAQHRNPFHSASKTTGHSASETFMWPTQGKLISTYGLKNNGIKNEGINILAAKGTPVTASRSGEVVYVGQSLESYGNLVLLKHPGEVITAYAHLDGIAVKQGHYVRQGQAIGTVGSTGTVNKPQLHFEVRKGKSPVDPMTYLSGPKAVASTQ